MRSKNIKFKSAVVALSVVFILGVALLTGCGETVDFFLKNQAASSSSQSSTASSSAPSFVPTVWIDYTNNPLFGGSSSGVNRAYYPSVVKVGPVYHIWYGDGQTTRHASSVYSNFSDVTFPAPEVTVGGTGIYSYFGSPGNGVYHPCVLHNATGWIINGTNYSETFLMYAVPNYYTVNILVSSNGSNWTDIGNCPSITNYAPQNQYLYNICVLYEGGTVWKAYTDTAISHFLYFTSTDGYHWTGQADNILGGTYQGWEGASNEIRPMALKIGSVYYLYYSSGMNPLDANNNNSAIGVATSTDGFTFVKSTNNPIFTTNDGIAWRGERTYTPWVIADGNIWRMYYTGRSTSGVYSIGTAVSTN